MAGAERLLSGRSHTKAFKVQKNEQRKRRQQVTCRSNGGPVGETGQQMDFTRWYKEAQDNIMRLNQSRLNALGELKSAHQRIADLEKRLGQATEQINSIAHHQPQQQHQEWSDFEAQEEQFDNEWDEPPKDEQPAHQQRQQQVMIAYSTGWKQVFIHFKTESQGWTNVPGQRLQPGTGDLANHQVAIIPTSGRVEFVMNNGEGSWDTPEYGGGGKNYSVEGPGDYFLKSGKVNRLR